MQRGMPITPLEEGKSENENNVDGEATPKNNSPKHGYIK